MQQEPRGGKKKKYIKLLFIIKLQYLPCVPVLMFSVILIWNKNLIQGPVISLKL